MPIKIRIPTPLQEFTQQKDVVEVDGGNVHEALASLEQAHTGIHQRLYDEKVNLRRFVNIYVNQEDIRFLQGEKTELQEGDEVSIVPAIAGGRR